MSPVTISPPRSGLLQSLCSRRIAAMHTPTWMPASVRALRHYSWHALTRDLIAGVTVGLVALPLAMAFAIASGLTPQAGIYCAVVTGFLISAFGGSRYQIGGPTGGVVVGGAGIGAAHRGGGRFMWTVVGGGL